MRRILAGIIISMTLVTAVVGQTTDTSHKARYGIGMSQFVTGSGFASGTELTATVIPDNRKNLSLGIYFCPERKKISGIAIRQEIMLTKFPSAKKVIPYAFINLIYRRTKIREVTADKNESGEFGMYKSIEHHLGLGLRVRIIENLYFKSAIGYGLYLGSIKKPSDPDPITGEIRGTNGFGAILSTGIAYAF